MHDARLTAGLIESRGDITLRDILAPLFRRKRLMIVIFSLLALASVLVGLLVSNTYAAHMEVLVNRERIDPMVTTEATAQMLIPAAAVTEEEVNSEAQLLSSRDVLEKVVLENGLEEAEKHSLRTYLFGKRSESEYVSLAVKHLGKKLVIDTPLKTNLINVTYKSSDPATAFGVLNSLATLYVEKHVAVHRPTGSYEFFAKEAGKYRDALADSESRLASFGKEQGIVAPDVERTNMALVVANSIGSLVQAEQTAASDQERVRNDRVEMEKTPKRLLTLQVTNASDKLLQDLRDSLLAAQVKRTQLLAKFEPSYPLVREADQEIADTQAAITEAQQTQYVNQTTDVDPTFELLREDAAKTQADLAAQRATVVALKKGIQDMQLQMVDMDQKALKQADLLRDAKANEDNYLLYVSKREQERASNALDKDKIANVAIAVPPVIPTLPLASLSMVVMIGFVVAAAGSAGAAYAVEFLDSSFRTPGDVIDILGIQVVAAVPKQAVFPRHSIGLLRSPRGE
ncbi:MAG: Wzz/FepE/Etk N-terminal domain-containing protein [Candidatus Acidiferrales bacterium]